jgi:hypothetical protein
MGFLIKHWDVSFTKDRNMYFIDSPNIFDLYPNSKKIVFINESIFKYKYKTGTFFNPSYLCIYALMNLNNFYKKGDEKSKTIFLEVANWLVKNAKKRGNAFVWTFDFDWKEYGAFLKKPWISAMSQGLAISVLSRAYNLTKDKKFLKMAYGASSIFNVNVEDGGIKTIENNYTYYEEYPAKPYPRVLDGFIFSLLGLYDLYSIEKNKKIKHIFNEGIKTLEKNLFRWDFFKLWSRYGAFGLLSSRDYNNLNCVLLRVLYELTKKKVFYDYYRKWSTKNLIKNLFAYISYVIMFFKILLREVL